MSQFRRRASALKPGLVALVALVAIASCLLLSACLDGGDGASAEPRPSTDKFRTLGLLAGPAERGGAGDRDGRGSEARLNRPTGLALASDGSLWLSQAVNGKIKRISPEGEVRTVYDLSVRPSHLDANGRRVMYENPGAMVGGAAGDAYIAVQQVTFPLADEPQIAAQRWAVLRVTAAGQAEVFAVPGSQDAGPMANALAINSRGELFIADTYHCAIWRADGKGDAAFFHTNTARGDGRPCRGFDSLNHAITHLTFDNKDRLVYIAASGDLRRLEADGSASRIGSAPNAAFNCGAMAYAPNGNLVVIHGAAQILLASPGQDVVSWLGKVFEPGWSDGEPANARFGEPCGLAINAAGDTFIADRHGNTVRSISSSGMVSTLAGLAVQEGFRDGQGEQARFGQFVSLAAARDGAVWIADASNVVIRRVDLAGTVTTVVGDPRSGPFNASDGPLSRAKLASPAAVAETSDGTLWIADSSLMRRLGTDGVLVTRSGNPSGSPRVLAPGSAGDLLVLSGDQAVVQSGEGFSYFHFSRYAAQGTLDVAPTVLETHLPTDLALQANGLLPAGMCVARSGELFFSLGHAVIRRGNDGVVTLYAGAVASQGSSDGAGGSARFKEPAGLACADDGAIFVADSGNHTVRRISAERTVTTVLGRPGQPGHSFGSAPGGLHTPRSLALVPGGLVISSGLGLVIARY